MDGTDTVADLSTLNVLMSIATNSTEGTRSPANEKPPSIVRSVLFICRPLNIKK
jgi:hypothetical protein